MLRSTQQRPDRARAEELLAADARGTEAGAMKRVPEGERLVAASRGARELQRHLDRVGATGREQQLAEIAGRDRREFARQSHYRFRGEAARREGKLVQLRLDGRDQPGM